MRVMISNCKMIAFCCNWSVYPGLQLSRMNQEQKVTGSGIIVNMCSGRLDPELILQAFRHGAWGVLIACCPPEECEHDGNYKATRRVLLLKNLLEQLGIEPTRLRLEQVATGEAPKLKKAMDNFEDEINKMGPI